MTDTFNIDIIQDDARGILRIVAAGPMESVRFVDAQIAKLSALDAPWAYNRIMELSEVNGACAYEELARFAAWWTSIRFDIDRTIRMAMLSRNGLTVARLPTMELMFPRHEMRVFDDLAEAEAWVSRDDWQKPKK
jgi:hypothetical protein